MSDFERYIAKRKKRSPEFEKDFESGYQAFEFSVMLREAREKALGKKKKGETVIRSPFFANLSTA